MSILDKIQTDGLILDGAMGSMLIAKGLTGTESAEFWNLTRPETIKKIHQSYYLSGADVASANTFGASPLKLDKMGLGEHAEKINRAGVRLARQVCPASGFVAGDMGSIPEMLQPSGPVSFEQAQDSFARQAAWLDEEGVDFFLVETVFDLQVALAALKGIQSVSNKPVFCSLTFKEMKKGFFTIFGNSPEDSVKSLEDAGAAGVGANCSLGSGTMVELARRIRAASALPVIIQPNAGMPRPGEDQTAFYPEDARFFAENIRQIRSQGVEIVGGCCGTTPDYIRTIKTYLSDPADSR